MRTNDPDVLECLNLIDPCNTGYIRRVGEQQSRLVTDRYVHEGILAWRVTKVVEFRLDA